MRTGANGLPFFISLQVAIKILSKNIKIMTALWMMICENEIHGRSFMADACETIKEVMAKDLLIFRFFHFRYKREAKFVSVTGAYYIQKTVAAF